MSILDIPFEKLTIVVYLTKNKFQLDLAQLYNFKYSGRRILKTKTFHARNIKNRQYFRSENIHKYISFLCRNRKCHKKYRLPFKKHSWQPSRKNWTPCVTDNIFILSGSSNKVILLKYRFLSFS